MTDLKDKYYLAMSNLCVGNPLFKAKLFEYLNFDIEKTFNVSKDDIKGCYEANDGKISVPRDFLKSRDEINPDKIYEDYLEIKEKEGINNLTYSDEKYPYLLKTIPDFPLMLYYKGDLSGINFNRTVAFVGSRKASLNAKETLSGIISGFLGTDIVIVSGLAEGIDTTSHKSALECGLKTIGVIGSGFKFIYPSSNKKLYSEIENGGGVIFSEYPYGLPPVSYQFPLRNRIVAGMSYGTVVAEARMKSGAMISARLTLEFNRELMCMPGLISNPNTEGIYYLLKNGAAMVTNACDILETLNWEALPCKEADGAGVLALNFDGIEKEIYDEIALEAQNMEDLSQKLNIPVNDLMVNLTSMELKGLIKQAGGNYFISAESQR